MADQMSSILGSQRLEVAFFTNLELVGHAVAPFQITRAVCLSFNFRLAKKFLRPHRTGHYPRTVFDIKADNHTQTQQLA
jgi:hypothetical protein